MILPHDSSGRPTGALDLNLIRKYSVPGPRYTSYPPATKFTAAFGPAEAEAAIRADNATAEAPLSLYFHLPFCETRCWFCGCNTVITRRRDAAGDYLDDLEREMDLVVRLMEPGRTVAQIHLGGGTPTTAIDSSDRAHWSITKVRSSSPPGRASTKTPFNCHE